MAIKGHIPWNKGKKMTKEYCDTISRCQIGKVVSDSTKQKMSVAHKGERSVWFGKKIPLYARKKMSAAKIGKPLTESQRENLSEANTKAWKNPIIRAKYYDALQKTKWLKVRSDVGQKEFIEKWNKLGFNFEINFQLKTDNFLCYLDGYDKERNVVIEFDGKYHTKPHQQKKDLERQQQIIQALKPKKFWRYDSTNRVVRDVTCNN